jgi:predicted DNA-binding protein
MMGGMKNRQKLSENYTLRLDWELRQWLDELSSASKTDRGSIIRSILRAVRDDDRRAHSEAAE